MATVHEETARVEFDSTTTRKQFAWIKTFAEASQMVGIWQKLFWANIVFSIFSLLSISGLEMVPSWLADERGVAVAWAAGPIFLSAILKLLLRRDRKIARGEVRLVLWFEDSGNAKTVFAADRRPTKFDCRKLSFPIVIETVLEWRREDKLAVYAVGIAHRIDEDGTVYALSGFRGIAEVELHIGSTDSNTIGTLSRSTESSCGANPQNLARMVTERQDYVPGLERIFLQLGMMTRTSLEARLNVETTMDELMRARADAKRWKAAGEINGYMLASLEMALREASRGHAELIDTLAGRKEGGVINSPFFSPIRRHSMAALDEAFDTVRAGVKLAREKLANCNIEGMEKVVSIPCPQDLTGPAAVLRRRSQAEKKMLPMWCGGLRKSLEAIRDKKHESTTLTAENVEKWLESARKDLEEKRVATATDEAEAKKAD